MDLNKEVDGEFRFFLNDGRALRSLAELKDSLKDMNESLFQYHVNQERNDFSNWIQGVFKDKRLASSVKNCSSKEEIVKVLETKPKALKKKIENIKYIIPPISRNKAKLLDAISRK